MHGCSTVVLICFTCPAITVATVILRALDRVRGRALGWLGPGSPKSQPHQRSGGGYIVASSRGERVSRDGTLGTQNNRVPTVDLYILVVALSIDLFTVHTARSSHTLRPGCSPILFS